MKRIIHTCGPKHLMIGVTVVCICIAVIAAYVWLENAFYRYSRSAHIASLAAAISRCADSGPLPETFNELRTIGGFGRAPYRHPLTGWQLNHPKGPEPHYLPVRTRDRNLKFIVAVEANCRLDDYRGYVILGDWSSHFVNHAELERLLVEDDMARKAHGETRLWANVNWRD